LEGDSQEAAALESREGGEETTGGPAAAGSEEEVEGPNPGEAAAAETKTSRDSWSTAEMRVEMRFTTRQPDRGFAWPGLAGKMARDATVLVATAPGLRTEEFRERLHQRVNGRDNPVTARDGDHAICGVVVR